MAAKILVTGATGTVGRVIVRDLIKKGYEVRVGVHTADKFEYIKMSGVEATALEFGDFSTIDRSLQDIKSLFLITPFAREEVEFVRRVVDRARMWGVEHIVKLSMLNADAMPGTQFTRWHHLEELYIEKSGIPFTFIRPNAFMQNFLRYVQPSGSVIAMPLNGALVSYIDTRDIGAVATEVLISGKDFYGYTLELTGPEAIAINNVADILTRALGYHIEYIQIPEDTARHILESIGTPGWMADGMLELYAMQREGMNSVITGTVDEICGRMPISFETFTRDNSVVFKAIVQHEHHSF